MLPATVKFKIRIQRIISFIALPMVYGFYWASIYLVRRHKIPAIKSLRQQFNALRRQSTAPILICPNHLTFVDSIILTIGLSSLADYLLNFRSLAWNFPKTTHMKRNLFYRIICYLGKCIFINLEAPSEQLSLPMNIAKYLLSNGEYIMLFPEGHRGCNGRVDTVNFTYGAGKLLTEHPQARLLCIYLRGDAQQTGSNFPAKYDSFYCQLQLINPPKSTTTSSLRATRDTVKYIIQQLALMEQEYLQQRSTSNQPNYGTINHELS